MFKSKSVSYLRYLEPVRQGHLTHVDFSLPSDPKQNLDCWSQERGVSTIDIQRCGP